ncbi:MULTISPECIES: glutamate--cysteine ligase family protein [Thiorhodovibrio]|uniref:glutamate--cysteine ligase n=1 Tax=Thiorhodovibrio TaxID=61593 RepID=UPI001913C1B3|nr:MULTISPECIES: glutamate--cysteine ligase [Thiorhodovibrio]MBK5970308.1 glutamate--cysteine ligase [Thiorhodovibrio winogradskyi]WPL13728.1 carboxylate-amine ligase [Thiorhodovibrio litoralis]
MGHQISDSRFTPADFAEFQRRLERETELLAQLFAEGALADGPKEIGIELEVYLIDRHAAPADAIEPVLAAIDDPLVVPELAQFNLELNTAPRRLGNGAFSQLADELEARISRCRRAAAAAEARLIAIGILPTLRPDHLSLARMTERERFRALNEQIFSLRGDLPIRVNISGEEQVQLLQPNVMLEAAATACQLHIKIAPAQSARYYNAAKILSAPMVAVGANSPLLFGRELWAESRIPLFEQAVSVGGPALSERFGFGVRYAKGSVMECFRANVSRYPALLPELIDAPPEALAHLSLHNGTIWRWNRPLIGFEPDGQPHLRLEHRVLSAGPTVADNLANAAFFIGALHGLADLEQPPEERLRFWQAKRNFYRAAQHGMQARLVWYGGDEVPVARLIEDELLPLAREGLRRLGVDRGEISHWLDIIANRARLGRTGAAWQCAWVARHGMRWEDLTEAYLAKQESARPVHEWTLD